ncbi:MAG: hypothetical protein ACKPEN_15765 [Planktothrix sp.]|uniref:hypothetical protein n=1 Tax=Planktothrix sp. TaxID=3088171 RepID=UPI0038D3809A
MAQLSNCRATNTKPGVISTVELSMVTLHKTFILSRCESEASGKPRKIRVLSKPNCVRKS